ncbi:MAG TPA: right-handed parallel beta-helix repeat-containing protein [Vicinamibacteria bacterium]
MKMKNLALGLLALTAAAATAPAAQAMAPPPPGPRGCYDPADFGAIPNDGIDDRVPAQRALDAAAAAGGGRVCFGHGRWRLTRAPAGSYNRFAALATHGAHIEIQGAGPGTVLEVVGDQGAAATWVISIDPGARDIAIRDLTIDTSAATNTDEQFHAIEIGNGVGTGTVEDVSLDHVRFNHPSVDGARKGDCLRLVGNTPESAVRRVTVIGGTFTACARSGIAIQRNVFDLTIQGNQFTQASDQDIDSEPSGGVNDLNGSISIIGNTFRDDVSVAQGDFAVTIGGIGGPMARVIVSGNIFEGRGINFYRASDVAVTGNTFVANMESAYGVINSGNVLERVSITGNTIRRAGVEGAAIRLMHQSGKSPGSIVIADNVITQDTAGSGILTESAQNLTVANNEMNWTVPAPNALGFYLRSTIRPADGIMITGNRINAQGLLAAVFLGAAPQPFRAVSIVGNMARGATVSVRCDGAGLFEQPIVHAANNWETAPTCPVPLVASRP